MRPTFRLTDLVAGFERLGLASARIAIVHSSLSAFGWVEGGAGTVIGALRAVVPTLVVPAFDYAALLPRPPDVHIPDNADEPGRARDWDEFRRALAATPPYRGDAPPHRSMGAIPAALLGEPDVMRSPVPTASFAAVGPRAASLTAAGTLDFANGVLHAAAREGALIVLLGVGHTVNTTIHVAEHLERRGSFTRFARVDDRPEGWIAVRGIGGNSSGFDAIEPHLRPSTRETAIGNARCRAVPAQRVIDVARRLIRRDETALLNLADEHARDAVNQRRHYTARIAPTDVAGAARAASRSCSAEE